MSFLAHNDMRLFFFFSGMQTIIQELRNNCLHSGLSAFRPSGQASGGQASDQASGQASDQASGLGRVNLDIKKNVTVSSAPAYRLLGKNSQKHCARSLPGKAISLAEKY